MQAFITERKLVTISRKAIARISKAMSDGLCFACLEPLGDSPAKRHCHERCYRATLRAVEKGQTTIDERVSEGKLAGDSENRGRPPSNPVTVELTGG